MLTIGACYITTVALGAFDRDPALHRVSKFDDTVPAEMAVLVEGRWPEPLNEDWWVAKVLGFDLWVPVAEGHLRLATDAEIAAVAAAAAASAASE